jgi:hypothetical protein
MDCPAGAFVDVRTGVSDGGTVVLVANVVTVATGVDVDTFAVAVAPITTGVAVNIEGVSVGGRNGVGGLLGRG